ncbi:TetR/AcrR family transcriptional regulator C-terminal domain-containing protein [Mycobacterium sp. MYCO198283]|uniref:TetR/AcrR family transcriptional regulator C-terminal domain-containing protein n=1 Tax=Mycobacterium sp. MYCO198283 TaxID=2883505 RepID=UPI001E312399|nr:TetR/AcrR family transcriptional regulator C-terminal domain-containing protein [Mycobacterium sp. MYCO198283]MCG5433520.1 TetR/AcrR family transcriptional regulator C-terminal domain-containing protein [Mycobacterium sp. MYCO198283]
MQLHRRDVVDAATRILDAHGIADLTMRRLARDLDVTPGALYWHFANKQQLLGAVSDRVLAAALAAPEPADWSDRLRSRCARLRDALLSHTDGAELVSATFAAGHCAAMRTIVAGLVDDITEAGLAAPHAARAARTVTHYVLGFTGDEQSRLQWDAAGAALEPAAGVAVGTADAAFGFGLRILVDGIRAQRASAPPAGSRSSAAAP